MDKFLNDKIIHYLSAYKLINKDVLEEIEIEELDILIKYMEKLHEEE